MTREVQQALAPPSHDSSGKHQMTPAEFDMHVQRGIVEKQPFPMVVYINATLAQHALGTYNIGNRRINSAEVARHVMDYTTGAYVMTHLGVAIDWNGIFYDGQHRLQAIIDAGNVVIPMWVFFGVDPDAKKVVDTGRARSVADQLMIQGYDTYVVAIGATSRIMLAVEYGGDTILKTRMEYHHKSSYTAYGIKYMALILKAIDLGPTASLKKFHGKGVAVHIAAVALILKHATDKTKAEAFITAITQATAIPGTIEHQVREKLLTPNKKVRHEHVLREWIFGWRSYMFNLAYRIQTTVPLNPSLIIKKEKFNTASYIED